MVQIDGTTEALMAAKTQAKIHPSGIKVLLRNTVLSNLSTRMLWHSGFLLPGHALLEREIVGILGTLGAVNFYLKVPPRRVFRASVYFMGLNVFSASIPKEAFNTAQLKENVGEHLLVVVVCFCDIIKRTHVMS